MKRKWKIFLAIGIVIIAAAIIIIPRFTKYHLPIAIKAKPKEINKEFQFIKQKAKELKQYCKSHQYSTSFACILDMNQHSGKKRFYVYDFEKDTIVSAGLVAHGSCNEYYLSKAKFSNKVGCGCSAYGRYKLGNSYPGRFGKAFGRCCTNPCSLCSAAAHGVCGYQWHAGLGARGNCCCFEREECAFY
jgi:hypothetical protein